jgi:hypothetical protein
MDTEPICTAIDNLAAAIRERAGSEQRSVPVIYALQSGGLLTKDEAREALRELGFPIATDGAS